MRDAKRDLLRLKNLMVASCTDCPGAQDDWPGCGGTAEKCSDDEPDCWKQYFLEEGADKDDDH